MNSEKMKLICKIFFFSCRPLFLGAIVNTCRPLFLPSELPHICYNRMLAQFSKNKLFMLLVAFEVKKKIKTLRITSAKANFSVILN
jgi:hypothetical protein